MSSRSAAVAAIACAKCKAEIDAEVSTCPACRADVGVPNVRIAGSEAERNALHLRYDAEIQRASDEGYTDRLIAFAEELAQSFVIVAMPADVAFQLLRDPKHIYVNYWTLVSSGARVPAKAPDARKRAVVDGLVFGSYASNIRFGALSLTLRGPAYGDVFIRLKNIAIQDRVSFLENNSYTFVNKHIQGPLGEMPAGFRAVWDNRGELAIAKLGGQLQSFAGEGFHALLLQSANDRATDEFIEAHVFDGFNVDAVQEVAVRNLDALSEEEKLQADLALKRFSERTSRGGSQ